MPRRRHVYCVQCGRGMALRPERDCQNCGFVHQPGMDLQDVDDGFPADPETIAGRAVRAVHDGGDRWIIEIEGGQRLVFASRLMMTTALEELRRQRTRWARELVATGRIRRRSPRARRLQQPNLPLNDDRVDRGNGPGED